MTLVFRLMTWNVNIYNEEKHQVILNFLKTVDVMFLTETKRNQNILKQFEFPDEFEVFINSHEPAQYHGVMMIIRKSLSPTLVDYQWNIPPRKDCNNSSGACGRILIVKLLDDVTVVGSYNPNSGRKWCKLDYRIIWDRQFTTGLNVLRQKSRVVWLGDLNVAPNDDDLSHPNVMNKWPGCSKEERTSFRDLISMGWIDTFRHLYPVSNTKADCYTWVGNGYGNYGMRLDHIIVSEDLKDNIMEVTFYHHFGQSDHTPVECVLSY